MSRPNSHGEYGNAAIDRIDELCTRFENQWRDGANPQIEEYLSQHGDGIHDQLLYELLAVEFSWVQRNRDVQLEAYHQRFPDDSAIVSQAFAEHVTGNEVAQAAPKADAQDDATARNAETIAVSSHATAVAGSTPHSLGNFELIEELGRGGMGVVYRARQPALDRLVALKVIRDVEFSVEELVERFRREAAAIAKLEHPGIVPIYEVGEADGYHFFAMRLVEGGTLADRCDAGPLTAMEAAELVKRIAEAVGFAHDRGMVHRDLKPGNILLDAKEGPLVADFGLAKKIDSNHSLTGTGQVVGTPNYMAPEQAMGSENANHGADIYSLGALLYTCLTGRPPFQASSTIDTLLQVIEREPVPPSRLVPNVPRDLETIVLKCLQKESHRRYTTAHELATDLQRFMDGSPIEARPIGLMERGIKWARKNQRLAWLGGALAASIIIGVAVSLSLWLRAEAALRTVKLGSVKNLITASAAGVPYLLPQLDDDNETFELLQTTFANRDQPDAARLHAAYGLSWIGRNEREVAQFLLDQIEPLEPTEARTMAKVLKQSSQREWIADELNSRARDIERNLDTRIRFAAVAAQLGDVQPLDELLDSENKQDPELRSHVIDGLRTFHGDFSELADHLTRAEVPTRTRAALSMALSLIPVAQLDSDERERLVGSLKVLAVDPSSAELHSAARLCLTRWNEEIPSRDSVGPSPGDAWFENTIGMVFAKVPGGKFRYELRNPSGRSSNRWDIDLKPFFVATTETTVTQYEVFLKHNQKSKVPKLKPEADWKPEHPMRGVNLYHAIAFCNWLSKREGLAPVYQFSSDADNTAEPPFTYHPDLGGYRLPTEAEWEYFCRAGSRSTYAFGDDRRFIGDYAVFATSSTDPVASRLPNQWGLFDCHGNVWEWCTDAINTLSPSDRLRLKSASNQISQEVGDAAWAGVLRGGSFGDYADTIRAVSRTPSPLDKGCPIGGFRVVLNDSGDRPTSRHGPASGSP